MEVLMARSYRTGLVVLAALSVLDLFGPLLTDGSHPPMAVAFAGAVVGLVCLVLVVPAWRRSRPALWALVGLRLLSAFTAVPAFFVAGVPAPAVGAAAGLIVLTLVGVVLVGTAARRPVQVGAR
jgi:hypothetical protein